MSFWGKELVVGKLQPFVPPPEAARLHLSQITLPPDAPKGKRLVVACKVGEDEFCICSLREGAQETASLDLYFEGYVEFSLLGAEGAKVHLTGYLMEEEPEEADEDDEDDELLALPAGVEELDGKDREQLLKLLQHHRKSALADIDTDSEEEYDNDEDEEDEEEDNDEDLEEITLLQRRRQPNVVIEDITDLKLENGLAGRLIPIEGGEDEKAEQSGKAEAAVDAKEAAKEAMDDKNGTVAKGKAAGKAGAEKMDVEIDLGEEDTDDEDSDEQDDEQSEDASDEDVEESEEEDEAPPVEAPTKRKATAAVATPAAKKLKAEKALPNDKPVQSVAVTKKKDKKLAAPQTNGAPDQGVAKGKKAVKSYPNGFVIETLAQGNASGKLAKPGKKVLVKYVGKLVKNGKVFDQTKGNKTFTFRLGVGEVIKGWDQGVVGMRVGDKRKLTVPPAMGYGASGVKGVIPGNAALSFEVELCDVKG